MPKILGETENSLQSVTTAYGLKIHVGDWVVEKQSDYDGRIVRINDWFSGLVMWSGDNVPSTTQWVNIYNPETD